MEGTVNADERPLTDEGTEVSEGRDRADLPYMFPSNLCRSDVRLVYLDLNHWISLSKWISGHKDGPHYRRAYDVCAAAVDEGEAEFPLSLSLIMEIVAIRNRQQRLWLRRAIERLSRFRAVLPRSVIAALEFEQVLATQLGGIRLRTAPLDYVGPGVGWAFGRPQVDPSVVDERGRDVTTEALSSMPPEIRPLFTSEHISYALTRMLIDGPTSSSEEADLRVKGWNPEGVRGIFDSRVFLERQLVEALDGIRSRDSSSVDWRKGKLRDVVAARELFLETNETFSAVLDQHGMTIGDVFDRSETPRAVRKNRDLTDTMPTFDVVVTLKSSYHRNPNHPWKRNDLFDIDAMATVLPYCDIVVTDKAMSSHVDRTKLASRLDTEVLSSLDDLVEHLTEARS